MISGPLSIAAYCYLHLALVSIEQPKFVNLIRLCYYMKEARDQNMMMALIKGGSALFILAVVISHCINIMCDSNWYFLICKHKEFCVGVQQVNVTYFAELKLD